MESIAPRVDGCQLSCWLKPRPAGRVHSSERPKGHASQKRSFFRSNILSHNFVTYTALSQLIWYDKSKFCSTEEAWGLPRGWTFESSSRRSPSSPLGCAYLTAIGARSHSMNRHSITVYDPLWIEWFLAFRENIAPGRDTRESRLWCTCS